MDPMARQRVLIVGASSGLGRALAEQYAGKNYDLALVSRDARDLAAIRADLSWRFRVDVRDYAGDITDRSRQPALREWLKALGPIRYACLVAGGTFEGPGNVPDESAIQKSMDLNYFAIVSLMNDLVSSASPETILVVSSIAVTAPRGANLAYTAAKTALDTYSQSLRHFITVRKMRTKIQILRLGYMDSIFTRGMNLRFPVAQAADVARYLWRIRDTKEGVFYYPGYWWFLCTALQSIPWFLYRRLRF